MARGIGLTAALALTWWVLSGQSAPLMLAFGVMSVAVSVFMAARMGLIDREGVPFFDNPHRRIPYLIWLGGQVAAANIEVVKLALRPNLDITPCTVRAPLAEKSDLGMAVFANSVTLTPGTVAVDFTETEMLIHALDASMASIDGFGRTAKRVIHAFDPADMIAERAS